MLSPDHPKNDHPEKLLALLKKYAEGHATEEEKAFVELYYNYFNAGEDGYEALSEVEKRDMENLLWGKVGRRIEEIEGAGEAGRTGPGGRMVWMEGRRKRLIRGLSVAAVLLLSLGSVYLFSRLGKKSVQPAAVAKYLAPGGNRAVLILGDGTRITLDSAVNGLVAQQGGVRVVKTATDELSYQATAGTGGGVSYNTMETPRGGQYRLSLPDGTRVWLNSASSIRYPSAFVGKDRSVELSGEAYFEVAKDSKKPFLVRARNMEVQVLGTEFNLMAYADEEEVQTTLVTGAVEVVKDRQRQQVRPGQQAAWADGSSSFRIGQADLKSVLAWKDGFFRFDNGGIAAIMRQIARWYDVEVVYEGAPPAEQFYGFLPRQEYASQILDALELTHNVHFRMEGKRIVVIAGPGKKGRRE
ncbi:MAG TPA: FecR family protein [Puia sp.]|nr:FecR family protein [Puia sp.]